MVAMKLYVPSRPLIGRDMKLVMFRPASRSTSSRFASTPGPVLSGMNAMIDSYSETGSVVAPGAGIDSTVSSPAVRDARSRSTVMASSRGASARNSVRAPA